MKNIVKRVSYLGKRIKAMASKLPSKCSRTVEFRSQASLFERFPALSKSFSSPLGRLLIEQEQSTISSLLREYPGSKILHLSLSPNFAFESPSPFRYIAHGYRGLDSTSNSTNTKQTVSGVISDFHALPFANEEFDIVIVQHVLEFTEQPQGALKEAGRVTASSGHVVVIAFNPLSLSGIASLLLGLYYKHSLWDRRYLLDYRLRDWLKFIDFTFISSVPLCHLIPINSASLVRFNRRFSILMSKLKLPFSSVTCIVARKDQLSINLLDKRWKNVSVGRAFFSPSPSATAQVASGKVLPFRNK